MKTTNFFSFLFLASTLLTSACTPADKAITNPEMRAKIQAQNARKSGGGAIQGKGYQVGSYQVSSLLMEKQIEAIELVRLALLVDDGTKSNSKLKDKTETPEGYTAKLSLNSAPLAFNTDKGEFVTALNKNLNVVVNREAGKDALTVKLSNEGAAKQSLDRKNSGKAYVNLIENSLDVIAEAHLQDRTRLLIQLKSSGGINGYANNGGFKENFDVSMNLEVDKASLEASQVKIFKVTGELGFRKQDGKVFKVSIEGRDLLLSAEGLCNTLVGKSTIKTDRNGKVILFTEEQVEVSGSNFKMNLAECGKRPTVDLSRLLP